MVTVKTLPVRLLHFGHVLDDGQRILGHAGSAHRREPRLLEPFQELLLGLRDVIPSRTVFPFPVGVGVDQGPEVRLLFLFFGDKRLIEQAFVLPVKSLERVFDAEHLLCRLARLLRPELRIPLQHAESPIQDLERGGQVIVAHILDLRHSVEAGGRAGVAGHKDELAGGGALRVPLQIVRGLYGLVVLVDAEKRHVKVVAGISEIVGVAPEKGDLPFRRKDQAHVGIFLVAIEPVLAPVVEGNHVGAQAGGFEAFALGLRDLSLSGIQSVFIAHTRFQDAFDARGDILDRDQDVQFEVRALQFFRRAPGVESVFHIVFLRG